jgi:hypothetical protein
MSEIPAAPTGSSPAAKRLWASVVDAFELDEHELALLTQACRTVTLLDALDVVLRREGPMVDDGSRSHPAAVESRLQSIILARVLAALRLPAGAPGDEKPSGRPKRSSGSRGAYGVRAAS